MSSPKTTDDTFADLQAHWARCLVASLADAGVEDVVISPGSRSTPFVLAAARDTRLRKHDISDERSAAFFALGRARVSGRPCLLVCTSGSAGAHYLPAVVEAAADRLPLLILTADRPRELHDAGANQTLDQHKLFGDHVRAFHDLGLADAAPRAFRALRRRAAQAVFQTSWPEPGPVHLNAPARKPLEPAAGAGKSQLARRVDALLERPIPRPAVPRLEPAATDVAELSRALQNAARGLVVAGPSLGSGEARDGAGDGAEDGVGDLDGWREIVEDLCARLGWPLLADTTSGLRYGRALRAPDALLRAEGFVGGHRPDLVLQVGRAPTPSSWLRRIGEWTEAGTDHRVVARHGWQDPESTASRLYFAEPRRILKAVRDALDDADPGADAARSQWLADWRAASDAAERIAEDLGATSLDEAGAVRAAVEGVPEGGRLIVGNSLPARMLDLFAPPPRGPVLHQRGLSGIDGLVAGAVGAALDGEPTLLLLGDVSLRHDVGSLALARRVERLVIVVLDNAGGRIFDQLPAAGHPAVSGTFTHWIQGDSPAWSALARAHGLRHRRPKDRAELAEAIASAFAHGGAWLIETKVPPHSAREAGEELRRRLDEALAEEGSA